MATGQKKRLSKNISTRLGATLGPLYHALNKEVTWLHAKWLEYRKLYAESEERVDLLNGTAASSSGSFRTFYGKMFCCILLG